MIVNLITHHHAVHLRPPGTTSFLLHYRQSEHLPLFRRGLLHSTKEAAELHANALMSFFDSGRKGEEEP